MFGRGKTQQVQDSVGQSAAAQAEAAAKVGGKGRPTPSRREAEQRGRTPLVRTPAQVKLSKNASKEEKKAHRAKEREARRIEGLKRRQALMTGDERYLPERDRGPVRRFVRDHVDARWSVGEFFIPAAVLVVLVGFFPDLTIASTLMLYGLVLMVVIDSILLRRRIKKLTVEKFGEAAAHGAPTYGMMRALQIRRTRLPRPMVKRGEYPS